MKVDITQHRIASGVIAAISLWICYLSFTQSPSEAYFFPRIISVALALTALFTFVKALLGHSKVGDGLSWDVVRNIVPGLVIGFVYLFWAAKALGFYTASFIAVFLILSVYDPKPNTELAVWLKRLVITIVFIAVL